MNWKGCGRKRHCRIEILSRNILKGSKENHEISLRDSRRSSRGPNHRISLHGDTAIDYVDACFFLCVSDLCAGSCLAEGLSPSKVVCGPPKWTAEPTEFWWMAQDLSQNKNMTK
jgi:hypothetical protein